LVLSANGMFCRKHAPIFCSALSLALKPDSVSLALIVHLMGK